VLKKAHHQHPLVAGNDVFGAVAMVHIEVDHGHTLQPAHIERVARCHGDVVEKAEAHGLAASGVVARRAHRTERVLHLAVDHRVGGCHRGACCAQHGLQRAWASAGVGVQGARLSRFGHALQQVVQVRHITRAVGQGHVAQVDLRRCTPLQRHVQAAGDQVVVDGVQPLGTFGVTEAHVVAAAIGVAVKRGGHGCRGMAEQGFSGKVSGMSQPLAAQLTQLTTQISTIIVGKRPQIEDCIACMLAGGHLLIEDVPGVGKTTLAHALAVSLGLRFSRTQFTADLMPSDLIGVSVYERSKESFIFHPGPVFAQVLLADEINRAGPKTQSALLEAMEEHQVTVEGETRALPRPFFVIATQNPTDQLGTYPLPESQLDRFLMCITLGYPDQASERALLAGQDRREAITALRALMTPEELLAAQKAVQAVHASEALLDYLQALIAATRSGRWSPRAGIAVLRAARARALLNQRDYVAPDDIQAVLPQTIAHRLMPVAGAGRGRVEQVRAMVEAVALP
jgi:MoxR-like ATPase